MARTRNVSPWAYWMLHLQRHARPDPCPAGAPSDELDAWRARFRNRLAQLLGPLPAPVPADVEVLGREDAGPYRRERVVFDTEAAMSVPAYLLVPHERRRPGPAVLAVHGHGAGKREICGIDGGAGDFAHRLALRGYVVLAPDLRCFGERSDWNPPDKYACDLNLVHALAAGMNPLVQNLWDLARALDVLGADPLVDPGRLGVVGFSYGATMTLFLAAWDERVRAAVVSGYFGSLAAAHQVPWNLCGSQVLPNMLDALDHLDLGALIAPRPLLVESGAEDLIFPLEAARRGVAELRKVYDAFGAGKHLEHDVFEGDHRWNGARAYDFLERELGPAHAAGG